MHDRQKKKGTVFVKKIFTGPIFGMFIFYSAIFRC